MCLINDPTSPITGAHGASSTYAAAHASPRAKTPGACRQKRCFAVKKRTPGPVGAKRWGLEVLWSQTSDRAEPGEGEPSQRRPREHRTSHLGGAVGLLLDGGSAWLQRKVSNPRLQGIWFRCHIASACVLLLWGCSVLLNVNFWSERYPASCSCHAPLTYKQRQSPNIVLLLIGWAPRLFNWPISTKISKVTDSYTLLYASSFSHKIIQKTA